MNKQKFKKKMRTETIGNIKVTLFDEVAYSREKNLVIVE
jgi:hypothetical protein